MKKVVMCFLPWPPSGLSPNNTQNRMHRYRVGKKYKADCGVALLKFLGASSPWLWGESVFINLLCRPPTRARRDEDNIIASLKLGLDTLAKHIQVDDSRFRLSHTFDRNITGGYIHVVLTPGLMIPEDLAFYHKEGTTIIPEYLIEPKTKRHYPKKKVKIIRHGIEHFIPGSHEADSLSDKEKQILNNCALANCSLRETARLFRGGTPETHFRSYFGTYYAELKLKIRLNEVNQQLAYIQEMHDQASNSADIERCIKAIIAMQTIKLKQEEYTLRKEQFRHALKVANSQIQNNEITLNEDAILGLLDKVKSIKRLQTITKECNENAPKKD